MTESSLEILRPVGRFEKYSVQRNLIKYYSTVGMTGTYEITLKQDHLKSLKDILFAALGKAIEEQAALGCTLVKEDKSHPAFAKLSCIDLNKVVTFVPLAEPDTELLRSLEKAHGPGFGDPDLPLWRILARYSEPLLSHTIATIITVFVHHALFDGVSAMAFHAILSKAINDVLEANTPAKETVIVPKLKLLPSIEEVHNLPFSPIFATKEVFRTFLSKTDDEGHWTGEVVSEQDNLTQLRAMFLPPEVVKSLLGLCRAHKVTMTALLTLVMARSLSTAYPSFQRFSCTVAVNFRRFTNTDKNALVNSVSSISHKFSNPQQAGFIPCGGDLSWNAVGLCAAELKAATQSPKNSKISLLRFLKDYNSYFKKQVGKKRDDSFEISNVGILKEIPGSSPSKVKIKRLMFSQCSSVTGTPCAFSVATAPEGDLSICVSWQEGIMEAAKVDQVVREIEQALLRMAGQEIV